MLVSGTTAQRRHTEPRPRPGGLATALRATGYEASPRKRGNRDSFGFYAERKSLSMVSFPGFQAPSVGVSRRRTLQSFVEPLSFVESQPSLLDRLHFPVVD